MATKRSSHSSTDFLLYRSETNKVLGGVCAGIGEALKIDPTLIRVLFLITFLFGGVGLLFYFILWIVVPTKSKMHNTSNETITENIEEVKAKAQEFKAHIADSDSTDSNRLLFGFIIIGLGVMFLLNNFGFARHFINIGKLWPLFLIAIGFAILSKRNR